MSHSLTYLAGLLSHFYLPQLMRLHAKPEGRGQVNLGVNEPKKSIYDIVNPHAAPVRNGKEGGAALAAPVQTFEIKRKGGSTCCPRLKRKERGGSVFTLPPFETKGNSGQRVTFTLPPFGTERMGGGVNTLPPFESSK